MKNCRLSKVLLDRGANIEAKTTYGATPLHWAADYGVVEVVEVHHRIVRILGTVVIWYRYYLLAVRPSRLKTTVVALHTIAYAMLVLFRALRVLELSSSFSCILIRRVHDSWRLYHAHPAVYSWSVIYMPDMF